MDQGAMLKSARADAETQAALIAALSAGQARGASAPMDRIYTHLSHLFFSGDQAFKLKFRVDQATPPTQMSQSPLPSKSPTISVRLGAA